MPKRGAMSSTALRLTFVWFAMAGTYSGGEALAAAERVEVRVLSGPARHGVGRGGRGVAQVAHRVVEPPRARLEAGEVVEQRGAVGMLLEALGGDGRRALPVARVGVGRGAEEELPRRDRVRLADGAADREHGRARLDGDRRAQHVRLVEEHARARGRVELLAGDGEARVARHDDVELLVPAGARAALVVLL